MARTGKTLSRTLRKDFSKEFPLPKSLFFINDVKFTAIAEVLLEGKSKPKLLVEFTPSQLKALMEKGIRHFGGAASASLNKRSAYGIYRKPPAPKPVAEAVEEAYEKIRNQKAEIEELKENEEKLLRSLKSRAAKLRGMEQIANDLERDLVESRKIYQSAQDENRKLQEKLDRLLGKEGRPRSSTDKQVESIDPKPYRRRLPGSHR